MQSKIHFLLFILYIFFAPRQGKSQSDTTPVPINSIIWAINDSLSSKPYLYYFHASWCSPCRFMNKIVFENEEVAEYLSKNVNFTWIDVDSKIGWEIKKKLQVNVLPTFYIKNRNSNHIELVAEETLSSNQLLSIIKKYVEKTN